MNKLYTNKRLRKQITRLFDKRARTHLDFVDSVNNALCEDADIFQNIRDQFSELENKIDSLEKKISELEAESY